MKPLFKGLLFGGTADAVLELIGYFTPKFRKYWDNPKLIYGYHIHHSVLGLLLIAAGVVVLLKQRKQVGVEEKAVSKTGALFLIGLGIGIVIVHSVGDGRFPFVECPYHNCPF